MMIQIDLAAVPSQDFLADLDGQYCRVWIYQRERRMYLDLAVGSRKVASGRACVHGADVLQYRSPLFRGTLHFHDFYGSAAPQYWGLGARWVLCYVPEGDALPERFRW
jgi:hypothetical protein